MRFAPSPTGYLHVGGVRTALYNWLFARGQGGTFILRIEDTDVERSTEDAVRAILDGLRWLSLDWDEGPDVGGPVGPYRQLEREALYREDAARLVREGKAYPCTCTAEELAARRDAARAAKRSLRRLCPCREEGPASGRRQAIWFHVAAQEKVAWDDLIQGRIEVAAEEIDDFIIVRSDDRETPQRLHGMGKELYATVTRPEGLGVPCRVYAPVGEHEDLLPYLVRRLLVDGANTSFVNRLVNENEPIERIVADPVHTVDAYEQVAHPRIPSPADIYQPERRNSSGLQLADGAVLAELAGRMQQVSRRPWRAGPVVEGHELEGDAAPVCNPASNTEVVGTVHASTTRQVEAAVAAAHRAQPQWNDAGADVRAVDGTLPDLP